MSSCRRVLVLGAGVAGATVCHELTRALAGIKVDVWDKV